MGLVGRDAEIRLIRAAIRTVLSGRGASLLICGEAGIGKTRLASEVADLASDLEMVVLTGRANQSESTPPLWPWRQALAGRPESDLVPTTANHGVIGEAPRMRWAAWDRVAAGLASSSVGTATVIVMEDMHWADESSLQLMAACAGTAGVLIAVTFRDQETTGELGNAIAAIQSRPDTARLALRPWTSAEVAAYASDLHPSWIPLLSGGSGGNPLVVAEMLSSLEEAGLTSTTAPTSWPLGVPAQLGDIIAQRVRKLSASTRAAVLAVHLLGEPASPLQIAKLAELDAAQAHQAVADGVAARLLIRIPGEPMRVMATHELVGSAGYGLIDARTRLQLHRRAADLIEAGGIVGDLVTHRLRCIVDETDRDRALQACRASAAAATDLLGYDRAVSVLEAALALPGLSPAMRSEVLLEAATAEYRRGSVGAALQRCQQASAGTRDAEVLARAALVIRGVGGQVNGEIIQLCDRALDAVPAGATALRAKVLAQKSLATSEILGPVETGPWSSEALELAESSFDPEAIMLALHARHQAISGPDHVATRVTLAERMTAMAAAAGDLNAELWGRLARIDAAFELGEPVVLRDNVTRLGLLADRLGWPLAGWHAHRLRAAIALLGGDFQAAEDETTLARAAAERTRVPVHSALLGLLDFQRREHLGQLAEVAEAVKTFATGLGAVPVAWSNGGALLLAAGDRDAAQDCYERLRPVLRQLPPDGRWFFTVLGAAELALSFDDADTVNWCYRTLLPYADLFQAGGGGTIICRGSVSRLLGGLAAASGNLDAAETHLSAAVAADDRIGAVPFRALSQLGLASLLFRRGQVPDIIRARQLVATAATTMRRLGMTPALTAADALDAQLRRSAKNSVSLTERESQVLALLARGASNRAIAATLVVSERTAEYHVANILAKIGASNRTEAATWALRNGIGTSP